ncbi:MAG: fumarylacetoacetate hydrolase family protein [Mucilaginibacter polytrichastri]|nr:fumarylacetoacetate hydrolase family protein [Mucilaginibacter polytrichastri]
MKLFKTVSGIFLQTENKTFRIDGDWDTLVNRDDLHDYLKNHSEKGTAADVGPDEKEILAPLGSQEIWAAGVTYLKSRDARMEESHTSGGSDLYDRVYEAERPELFFKATAQRVADPGAEVYIRRDSDWNVPEPELTLFISSSGKIQGYTIGNDMSSRSIEGENALYLPQAKVYEKCAAIGPCLYVPQQIFPGENGIHLRITRGGKEMYADSTPVSRMKRKFDELAGFLFRECDFPNGAYLMTGTCLVPPSDFTLNAGDVVEISIDGIGTLVNTVAYNPKHKNG